MHESLNFVEAIIQDDKRNQIYKEGIATRFPPEPNGYLHLGHAKSICLNFGLASKYKGTVNLRFDDTNPERESSDFVDAIKNDIRWLGYEWQNEYYASDYYQTLYDLAIKLIKKGLAYVDDSTSEEIALLKGTPLTAGQPSKYRDRSAEENLSFFEAMKHGRFKDGEKVLRAKIDMGSANMHMRDPIMYRIKHAVHHRTDNKWCIYPMYDFAHGQCDAIEHISHSTCTLEFVEHRQLYNWFIAKLELFPSKQIEFARLNLAFTVMSKRKLQQLVQNKLVDGWDDPRLPTIAGLRRRGYTPTAIRDFCDRIGVAKRDTITDYSLLEFCAREDLNKSAQRRIAILRPLKVIITNYDESLTEEITLENLPGEKDQNNRTVPFTRNLWIEQDDFMENPPKNYFRLSLGAMVRLKGAYIILCENIVKDSHGNISELHCKYLPDSKSGNGQNKIKVKSTIHWLSTTHAVPAEIRLYDKLLNVEIPGESAENFIDHFNKDSLRILPNAYVEQDLSTKEYSGVHFQFIRLGYFIKDKQSSPDHLIFNRTVSLKESGKKYQFYPTTSPPVA